MKPEPATRGSLLEPVAVDEAAAIGEHLTSDAEARDWGRQGWARAAIAKAWCEANR